MAVSNSYLAVQPTHVTENACMPFVTAFYRPLAIEENPIIGHKCYTGHSRLYVL